MPPIVAWRSARAAWRGIRAGSLDERAFRRQAWYSRSSVQSVSPCSRATSVLAGDSSPRWGPAGTGRAAGREEAAAGEEVTRLPCMKWTGMPASTRRRNPRVTSAASGSPAGSFSSSSPAQYSNRSPSTYKACARAASSLQEAEELLVGIRAFACEVQVGNEKRPLRHSLTWIILIGHQRGGLDHHHLAWHVEEGAATSVGKGPPDPVGVFEILVTTSMPETTLPNTV